MGAGASRETLLKVARIAYDQFAAEVAHTDDEWALGGTEHEG